MRERWATIVIVGAIGIGLLVYLVTYTVPVTKVAVHKRFGRVIRIVKPTLGAAEEDPDLLALRDRYPDVEVSGRAGLYFKLPPPFDTFEPYDQRIRYVDGPQTQIQLEDQYQLIPRVYATWRISDPVAFQKSLVGDPDKAMQRLKDIIGNSTGEVFGASQLHDVVNTRSDQLRFDDIEAAIFEKVQQTLTARETPYGVEVSTLGITWVALPEQTTNAVFERMTAERKKVADAEAAAGQSIKEAKISEAEAQREKLLAEAEAKAKQIRARAEAEAAQYLPVLAQNPELARYLRNLEGLVNIARDAAQSGNPLTLVVSTQVPPFNVIQQATELEEASAETGEAGLAELLGVDETGETTAAEE